MYSDINELRVAYYKFLREDTRYSELCKSYDKTNNRFLEWRRRMSVEIDLLEEKIKGIAHNPDYSSELNSLKVEKMMKKEKLNRLVADHQLKLKPILRKQHQLEKKLRPKFFEQLKFLTDQQLAIISESIETAEKPMRIHGIPGAGKAADEWWSFANDFERWMINKDAFNQSKSTTLRQALIIISLLVITISIISRLV